MALERRRLIQRTPDPDNARILRTTLTREGARALLRGGTQAARVESRLVSPFTTEEQHLMRGLLERCAAALGAKKAAV